MNRMVFILYSETIQFQAGLGLNLTSLPAIISPYLAKFMIHNKSNTVFLHDIVIIFSPIYLSDSTYVISSLNLMVKKSLKS